MSEGASSLAVDGLFWRRVARAVARNAPDWFVRIAAPAAGTATAAFLPRVRENVVRNLHLVRGDRGTVQDALDVARTLSSYAGCLNEALAVGSRNAAAPHVVLVGRKHFDHAASLGKGILLGTVHSGGWELVGPLLASYRKSELVMVMESERDERARAIQDAARRANGLSVVHVGEDPLSALPILRHLRDGNTVAFQVDRVPRGMRSIDVRLLAGPWRMPMGPLRLAQVSGAPLVPIFSARTGLRRYVVEAHPPIVVSRRAGVPELQRAAQKIADAISAFLREHPTQWFHFVDS